jgi:hypothetical protein
MKATAQVPSTIRAGHADGTREHAQVLALEEKFWSNANDAAFFKESFAEDGLTILEPMGFIEKAQAVAMASQGKAFEDLQMSDVHIRQLTADCVMVAYHGQANPKGSATPYLGTICSIYVKKAGHWQLAVGVHQPWKPQAASSDH